MTISEIGAIRGKKAKKGWKNNCVSYIVLRISYGG